MTRVHVAPSFLQNPSPLPHAPHSSPPLLHASCCRSGLPSTSAIPPLDHPIHTRTTLLSLAPAASGPTPPSSALSSTAASRLPRLLTPHTLADPRLSTIRDFRRCTTFACDPHAIQIFLPPMLNTMCPSSFSSSSRTTHRRFFAPPVVDHTTTSAVLRYTLHVKYFGHYVTTLPLIRRPVSSTTTRAPLPHRSRHPPPVLRRFCVPPHRLPSYMKPIQFSFLFPSFSQLTAPRPDSFTRRCFHLFRLIVPNRLSWCALSQTPGDTDSALHIPARLRYLCFLAGSFRFCATAQGARRTTGVCRCTALVHAPRALLHCCFTPLAPRRRSPSPPRSLHPPMHDFHGLRHPTGRIIRPPMLNTMCPSSFSSSSATTRRRFFTPLVVDRACSHLCPSPPHSLRLSGSFRCSDALPQFEYFAHLSTRCFPTLPAASSRLPRRFAPTVVHLLIHAVLTHPQHALLLALVCALIGWGPQSIRVPHPPHDTHANNPGYCFLILPCHLLLPLRSLVRPLLLLPPHPSPFLCIYSVFFLALLHTSYRSSVACSPPPIHRSLLIAPSVHGPLLFSPSVLSPLRAYTRLSILPARPLVVRYLLPARPTLHTRPTLPLAIPSVYHRPSSLLVSFVASDATFNLVCVYPPFLRSGPAHSYSSSFRFLPSSCRSSHRSPSYFPRHIRLPTLTPAPLFPLGAHAHIHPQREPERHDATEAARKRPVIARRLGERKLLERAEVDSARLVRQAADMLWYIMAKSGNSTIIVPMQLLVGHDYGHNAVSDIWKK
ncbi:hypothetical protein C8J57DRAFT_1536044 [Mycena rebaudengoi]|nr:hypothetical protein C8J57DRAFT_1536044 [Mycena rebaudengoi]